MHGSGAREHATGHGRSGCAVEKSSLPSTSRHRGPSAGGIPYPHVDRRRVGGSLERERQPRNSDAASEPAKERKRRALEICGIRGPR